MLSALKGYAVEAENGVIGRIAEFLFDDFTWKVRWLVVDVGSWLTERKILINLSAVGKRTTRAKCFQSHRRKPPAVPIR